MRVRRHESILARNDRWSVRGPLALCLASTVLAASALVAVAGDADREPEANDAKTVKKLEDSGSKSAQSPVPISNERATDRLARVWPNHPEWVAMLVDILEGSRLGPGDGWFKKAVSQTRFDWKSTRERFDRDHDGAISLSEFGDVESDFRRLDRDGDRKLTEADFNFSAHALAASPGMIVFYRADRNGDGRVTHEEIEAFFKKADSGDAGFLSLADLQRSIDPPPSRSESRSSDTGPTRLTLVRGLLRQEIGSLQSGPKLDESAPDFTLKTVDGKREITLSQTIGEKPVVLIFGNFTCGPFRSQAGNVEKLYRRYKDRATFLMVYVREAHPNDGWRMESNDRVGVSLDQPVTYEERVGVARTCVRTLGFDIPVLVDTIQDVVGARYSGMPSRLYLIDSKGEIAYKSGRGPFGFKPAELEHSLILMLRNNSVDPPAKNVASQKNEHITVNFPFDRDSSIKAGSKSTDRGAARVPLPDNDEAWKSLPRVEAGGGGSLPNWARALARTLPRTTAAMLDLDRLQRTRSSLGAVLRGKMRWIAADANQCDYSKAYAEADLRRAGVSETEIKRLADDLPGSTPEERAALEFARKMTLEADTVTDAEVAYLKQSYGETKLAAMVLLLAYSNFQDRLLLALKVPVEAGGPLAPLDVRFAKRGENPAVPRRVLPVGAALTPVPERIDDPEWKAFKIGDLRGELDRQKTNAGRIRVPTWDDVLRVLPEGYPKPKSPSRIQWSLVCMGYQPELAIAWSACTRAFGEEAKQDRVFEESQFWIVTRTIHCFY